MIGAYLALFIGLFVLLVLKPWRLEPPGSTVLVIVGVVQVLIGTGAIIANSF